MGFIDKTAKAIRLLVSRRYTHNTLTDAQEAFTSTFDINVSEIYADQNLIPSASLPFSGSSQKGLTHSVGGNSILKYWYRQKLTKSNVNNEVWFFLNPTGSDDGVGAQLINTNQQTILMVLIHIIGFPNMGRLHPWVDVSVPSYGGTCFLVITENKTPNKLPKKITPHPKSQI